MVFFVVISVSCWGGLVYAELPPVLLQNYSANDIFFYNPFGEAKNYCTSEGDCYIAGDSWDEKMWSALRHVGFTPEQTAGLIGNIVHEGGTPATQEYAYSTARSNGCTTAEGKPYDIHTDFTTDGVHHGSCIGGSYSAGSEVVGIGLGPVQWSSHGRREGYLKKMEELGLLKYFEGDAYKTYGSLSDEQLREKIKSETGSEADYWAMWCAAVKFIWTEMQGDYSGFFNNTTAAEYGAWASASYEICGQCSLGGAQYNARVQSANEYWNKYKAGEFDRVENGTATVQSGGSSSSTVAGIKDGGANVTIIGDSITNGAGAVLAEAFPKAEIIAQDSKQFTGGSVDNPSGLTIVKELKAENKLRQIVVIALGTNGAVTEQDIREMVQEIGAGHEIFFVNNYDIVKTNKYDDNNKAFVAAADTFDNVSVIDWKKAITTAGGRPEDYVTDEGVYAVHPTVSGRLLFAESIKDALEGVSVSDSCEPNDGSGELVIYYQSDEPWGSIPYGNCGGTTIGEAGCGPSSLAMIITAMTGKKVTPDEIAKKAAERGYRVCGSGSSHAITEIAKDYGLNVKDYGRPSIDEINDALKKGVMFQVAGSGPSPFSANGHFIAIRGITDKGEWLIFDSAHKGTGTNEKKWNPSEIYPYVSSDWRGVSK